MKEKMREILSVMHKYNSENLAWDQYRLEYSITYDALIVAPGWKPTKIIKDNAFRVTVLAEHSYMSSYLVERDGLKIAWIQTSAGACCLIDHLAIAAELHFKKLIFVGAVGSLTSKHDIGDLCMPEYSIEGVLANGYLYDKLSDYKPFGKVYSNAMFSEKVIALAEKCGYKLKKAPVFCTDSIALEYLHLDEIKAMGAELIEMETSSFSRMADLLEVPAVALLIVSDNSAAGVPLIGRSELHQQKYDSGRKEIIPDLIYRIAQMN